MAALVRTKTVGSVVFLLATLTVAVSASGQQFQDFTGVLFPSPNPSDYTNYIEAGDLNGDGHLDLVFANGGNFSSAGAPQLLRVYINTTGNGKFLDETVARTGGLTGNYRGVAFGDVERDGDLDMILSSDFNRQPRMLINDGNGFFSDETAARLPVITLSSTRAQFLDIDNDGDLDIYINNGGTTNRFGCGQNRIFVNNGDGVFADETNTRHPLGNVCQPMDVICYDFDRDFDLDICTGNRSTNQSKLYRNDGDGFFDDITAGNMPANSNTYSFDFGDIDGDGLIDLLGANAGPSNNELLLRGTGTGSFLNVSGQIMPNTTGDDNDSKFFDLDNDGDLDLIIASLFQTREKIYINDGNGNFTIDNTIITSNSDATLDVMVLDVNNDGRPDIVTGQGESGNFQNRIYLNVTGPPDTIPPSIVQTEMLSDTADPVGPYVVRTVVTDGITSDRGFFDKGVFLNYSVNAGPTQQVEMFWSGNSMWRGEIPGQPCGGTIEYFVTANDWVNNTGTGSTESFTVTGGGTPPPGDINEDCGVDLVDVDILVQVLIGADTDPTHVANSDLDGSGTADGLDIQVMIVLQVP
ncbi:MAG: VCBS repeat-containing protein [Planctomycetota bacterium]|nr:VCBS repeat-containing protein [Planctomycetota bacterium]